MKASVEQVYTSVGCNRTPEIIDWNGEGVICFGAASSVVIYDTKLKGQDPLTVLGHHKSEVNTVKWVRKPDGTCSEIISGSADKTIAIWSKVDGVWKVTDTLVGHEQGVSCVHGLYIGDDLWVYASSMDSSLRIWERKNGEITCKKVINLGSILCLTLHAHILPTTGKPIVFLGLDDQRIHVYVGDDYHKVHVLEGHEDWVRGLDVLDVDSSTILVASASLDTYIRIWRIQRFTPAVPTLTNAIRVEQKVFRAYDEDWSAKLEAVLAGHEARVYGVQWQPLPLGDKSNSKPIYRLLSSSLDKTLIIWEPEEGEGQGAWVERVRVGEVGGHGLGFYGSRFGPDGMSFLGHGYSGSFHIWNYCKETGQWKPSVVCGGHYCCVQDVKWEKEGRYLMSVSSDQTTRVHAPWNTDQGSEWHEIARPQVHGYNMASLALVTSTTFASAAEEKVIRVFRAPHNFLQNFKNIVGEELEADIEQGREPEGALVPTLGLSNKAVFVGDDEQQDGEDYNDGYFVPVDMTEPPTEETLMQHTLWPELQKLYGHGYEVFTLAASPDAQLLASGSHGTTLQHAAVLIWETSTWQQAQRIESHNLTVTQLAFAPDSQRLLSVSRDRRWTVYQRRKDSNLFDIAAYSHKPHCVHTRIIWCCAWSFDGKAFGTGSRDGKVCIWTKGQESNTTLGEYGLLGEPLELPDTSVTALDFAPCTDKLIVAMGFETGVIRLYNFEMKGWTLLKELNNGAAHHRIVKRLTFKPSKDDKMMLASCGNDHFVRIYNIVLDI